MNKLTLHRMYSLEATHGLLQFNGVNICFTLELPWLENKAYISCIPEGTYPLSSRYSSRFKHHIEVKKVPNRHAILFHPANNAKLELKGCIAPVSRILNQTWGNRSQLAMRLLLDHTAEVLAEKNIELTIKEASDDAIINLIKVGTL